MDSTVAPGARALVRDEEWLVRRVDPSSDGGDLLICDGVSELVRGRAGQFLTRLEERVDVLDPAEIELVADDSNAFNASMLYIESVLQRNLPNDEATLPNGPHQKARRYEAPFAIANREDDYRIAWAFFEAGPGR